MAYTHTAQKGETLNSIANKYGFTNYKEAGVTSVPSGNFDLIREGEQINLGNYNPNDVKPFVTTPQVLSSKDNTQQYVKDSEKLNGITSAFDASILGKDTKTTETKTPAETKTETSTSGNVLLDSIQNGSNIANEKYIADQEAKKRDYETAYQTDLALTDATAKANIDRINLTYDRNVEVQNRINALTEARTKAYGLANGGQYTPIDFGSAMSQNEEDSARKITSLNNERNQLIAEAKVARDQGASRLLREKLDKLDSINSNILRVQNEVIENNIKKETALKNIEKAKKAELDETRKITVKKIYDLAPVIKDNKGKLYSEMEDNEKDVFIKKLSIETGIDVPTIYSQLESSILKNATDKFTLEGKKATVANTWKNVNKPVTTKTTTTPAGFKGTIPDTFTGADDYNAKRAEFVRLNGTKGASHWDAVFPKDPITKDPTYTITKAPAPVITTPKKSSTFDASKVFEGKTKSGIGFRVVQ